MSNRSLLERWTALCRENPAFEVVEVNNLGIGMFVTELDRPWLGTPFLLQGFLIESEAQISRLRTYCGSVLIDRRRSIGEHHATVRRKHSSDKRKPSAQSTTKEGDFLGVARLLRRQKGPIQPPQQMLEAIKDVSLEEELLASAPIVDDVHRVLQSIDEAKEAIDNVSFAKIGKLVGEMASSVERNPDAMLWLTRLRVSDQYSYDHAVDVSVHAMIFGRFLGLEKKQVELLGQAGLLQDIGKSKVDPAILSKPSALDENEYRQVQAHVACSLALLVAKRQFHPEVIKIVAAHHERFDGSGYPRQLLGDAIGVNCELSGLLDTYCAMTRDRAFSPAIPTQRALEALYRLRDKQFRSSLVDQFIQCLGIYSVGTLVELNTGEVGIVIQQNMVRRLKPRVLILMAADKRVERRPRSLDLILDPPTPTGETYRIVKSLPPNAYGLDPAEFFLDQ